MGAGKKVEKLADMADIVTDAASAAKKVDAVTDVAKTVDKAEDAAKKQMSQS